MKHQSVAEYVQSSSQKKYLCGVFVCPCVEQISSLDSFGDDDFVVNVGLSSPDLSWVDPVPSATAATIKTWAEKKFPELQIAQRICRWKMRSFCGL